RDVAAHHAAESAAYGEAEPGAPILAGRCGGRLGKLLEQLSHLVRRHADPGIGHRNRDPVTTVKPLGPRSNGDRAIRGEVVGIAAEIKPGLPESRLIVLVRAKLRST